MNKLKKSSDSRVIRKKRNMKTIRRQRAEKARKTTFVEQNKYDYIRRPIITEKTLDETEGKTYTFEVIPTATKRDVKVLVEELYGVKVDTVRTMNTKKQPKTVGKHRGYRSGYKKAIVKLHADSNELENFEVK